MEFNSSTVNSKAILCDIEGTTSSIDFVKETLFPYALKNVEKFLQDNWDRDDVKEAVVELRKLATKDAEEKVEGAVSVLGDDEDKAKVLESVVKSVEWLMGNDRKVTPLKTLQGLIWEAGYKDGSIKGHVYDDVPKAFENWSKSGHKMYIYSSGSVMAQKLLFGNTTAGDLLSHLSGHFDTKIGAKQEKESYEAIAKEIECATEEILFLTDIVKEAKAAKEAGVNVVMLDRPGNAPLTDEEKKEFVVVTSFDALPLEEVTTGKRKIQEEEDKQEATKPAKVAKLEEAAEKVEVGETHDKKTDDEPKCDTAVEKIEIDRTDDAKTDQETESKVETEEKMDTNQSVEVVEEVKEEEKKEEKVEEVVEKEPVVATEKTEDEKMEVDAKETVESVEAVAVVEEKEPEAEEVTEAEPKVLEEKEEEVVEKTEPATEEPPAAPATDTVAEEKKEEEVVNGKSEVEKTDDTEKVEEKEATEATEAKTEEAKEEKKEETEKAAESTNGNAAEEVNGGGKKDDDVTEEKTENGKDEVKNGHNENAAVAVADEEKTAQESASASASDQVSEVIVKKCVEPIKSPVAQPVEAAES